jgi:hypothetical protein
MTFLALLLCLGVTADYGTGHHETFPIDGSGRQGRQRAQEKGD